MSGRFWAVGAVAGTAVAAAGVVAVASPSFAGHITAGNVAATWSAVTGSPRCRTADLSLSVVADTARRHHGGGMNHQGATIALRNISRHTCHVRGYPGAAMLTARGAVIAPGRVVRGSTFYAADRGPHTIVLRPGKSAYGELGWTSADGARPAVATASIIVTPPDERTHRTARLHTFLGGDRTLKATALTAAPARLAP